MDPAAVADHVAVFATAFLVVVAATPVARWLSFKVGAVDVPGGRRVHTMPTARLGGLAIFAGVLAAVGMASQLDSFGTVFSATSDTQAVLLAGAIVVCVGLVDDLRGLSPPVKLAGQVLAAGSLALFGVVLRYVYLPGNPGTLFALSPDLGALFTVVAIVVMVNALNLIDGLDGLAAGIAVIAAVALWTYVELGDQQFVVGVTSSSALIFVAIAGAALGFLVFNFHPARIFMGDTGAMLLGVLLGAGGILAIGGRLQPGGSDFAALSIPVLVPALVLAVPLADTMWTILRRVLSGRAIFSPDKKHLHHRLVEIGHSQRRAVLIMYYWSALVAFAAVGVGLWPRPVVVWVTAVGVGLACAVAVGVRAATIWRRQTVTARQNFVFSFTSGRSEDDKTPSDQEKRSQRRL